jgi:hypothetical protein
MKKESIPAAKRFVNESTDIFLIQAKHKKEGWTHQICYCANLAAAEVRQQHYALLVSQINANWEIKIIKLQREG